MSSGSIGVAHVGLGAIGLAAADIVLRRAGLEPAVAVDSNPDLRGRDLGDLVGRDPVGVTVEAEDEAGWAGARVAVLCTGSALAAVAPQLHRMIERGLSVVSSCEELSFPWLADGSGAVARDLDRAAHRAGVTVTGTGVNPGFVMDYLPLVLSAVTDEVHAVRVLRVQDARDRRPSLQRKVGAGLTAEEFAERVAEGRIGHVGLRQSAQALASGLGWTSPRVDERLEPVLADEQLDCALGRIEPGRVAGIDHRAVAVVGDREVVSLRLHMAVGVDNPRDEVSLDASPPVRVSVPGGFHGDAATAAILVNTAMRVIDAPPGLRIMTDLSPPHAVGAGPR